MTAIALLLLAAAGTALSLPAGASDPSTDPESRPADFVLPTDLGSHAVLSCLDLEVSGSAVILSDGLVTGGEAGHRGHARSNWGVRLHGGVEVQGDAIAGPGHEVVLSGQPSTVTGEIRVAEEPFDCAPIDLAALAAALEESNDNASLPLTEKGNEPLAGPAGRSLKLTGRDSLTLSAGTYLLDQLELAGNSRLRLAAEGEVRILVTGAIDIRGGSHLQLDGNPFRLRLWSLGDSVSIASQSAVFGFLYAPGAEVTLAGQSRLVGGLQGERVRIVGGSRVRRVVDDHPPALEVTSPEEGAVVEVCEIPVTGSASDAEGPVWVTVNGEPVELEADGSFAALTSLWTDEPGRVEVEAVDQAGNTTRVVRQVEIVLPVVTLTSPAPGSLVGERLVELAGTSGTATEVTVNASPAELPGDGTFRLAGFDLGESDGLVSLTLVGRNCGGERTSTATLVLDTKPPVVTIDSPAGGSLFGASPLTVSGVVEAAHLDSVTVNGVAATVDGNRFTAPGVELAEGLNTLVARAVDQLGRVTDSAPVTVELDTTVPAVVITEPVSGAVVATPEITVAGVVEARNLAGVSVNGVTATLTPGEEDATHFTAQVSLAEEENFLVATATDLLDRSSDSPSVVVVLDTLPPEVALDLAALPELTAETEIDVRGTAVDPHLETVTVNGVVAAVTGAQFLAEGVPLEEGENALVAVAVDSLGHSAETPPAVVVRDTLPPEVAVTDPEPGAGFATRTITVRGTVSDPHLDRVTVLGVEAAVEGEPTEATFVAEGVELPEGLSEVVARAVDLLGHAALSEPVAVVVDTLPPVVRLVSPEDPLVSVSPVTVEGTAEDPHLEGVEVAGIPAAVAADGSFLAEGVPLEEGANEITARAWDSFGHESESEPVLFVLDTLPPEIAVVSPVEGEEMAAFVVEVTGTVSDPHLEEVRVHSLVPGQTEAVSEVVAEVDEEAGTFAATLELPEGHPEAEIVAVATDRAGHSAEVSVTVSMASLLDSDHPFLTLEQPAPPEGACFAAGGLHTFGGVYADANPATGEEGQSPPLTLEVVDPSGARRSFPGSLDLAASRWTVEGVDLGSTEGFATVLVTAVDALDNVATLSATFRIAGGPPLVTLTLEGGPFPGQGPGTAPPPGATPILFGRQVSAGATVASGAAASPPAPALTLNGAPYAAGTSIAAEGTHLLVATATDCAGQSGAAHALFTVDTTAPALHATTPAEGARLAEAVPAFSGVSDPDLARARISANGAGGIEAAVSGETFTLALFPWKEGDNEVGIELEDSAGNRSSHLVRFAVRTVPLSVELLENGAPIAPGAVYLRAVRPEVRPSDATAAVAATLDGAPFTSGAEIAGSGTYQLAATATDDWGRTASAQVSFVVDLADGPEIAITSPTDGALVTEASVAVTGTVSGEGVAVTVNGLPAAVSGGIWSVAGVPLEADVSNEIVAVARDSRGRTASDGVTVRVATGGPQVLVLEPADGVTTNRAVIDVAGAVVGGPGRSATGTVTVAGPSGAVTTEIAPDGGFRALDLPLLTGPNTLTASVTDPEGRTGQASTTVTADFTPPVIRFLADGEPLVDGASFPGPVVVGVEVTDDALIEAPPSIRINGEGIAGAALPLTEIPLTEGGGYLVTVTATDAAGNQTRGQRSFVLDFGGCVLAEVFPMAGSGVTASSVTLVGRATGATAVTVRVPQPAGGFEDYSASLADDTFLAGDVPLPALGVNALELVCHGSGGQQASLVHPIERLAEGAGPAIQIVSPASGALLAGTSVAVEGTVSGGATAVSVNGVPATLEAAPGGGQTFRAASVPLSEGPNPILARALDAAGRSASDRVVVHRDSQAPRVQITRPDHRSRVGVAGSGPATVEVSGLVDLATEPHLASVAAATALGSVAAEVDMATGAFVASGVPLDPEAGPEVFQEITVTATDLLGHVGTSSVEVMLDPAGPAIVLSEPADLSRYGPGSPSEIPISGQAWGAPGTAVSINGIDLDPELLAWSEPGTDGRRHVAFSAALPLPAADGAFGLIARATDQEGRWAQDRRLLFRDTVGPRVVEMIPEDGAVGVDPSGLLLVLFSEEVLRASLDAADGLTLRRDATGESVVGSATVAGQAVGFAPGSALAAGESYLFRAGAGITDLAGNPLEAPEEVRFTVATPATAEGPVLAPLQAVLCVEELLLTGTAIPSATLRVRLGTLVFTGFAEADGTFSLSVPTAGSGYHLLAVWALDSVTGARSPETTAVVRIDCREPTVQEAHFDRGSGVVTITFSEAMAPASLAVGSASDAIRLLDAEVPGVYRQATLSQPEGHVVELALDPDADAWWRERPVRLQVGPPAADLEGNEVAALFETVFFPAGEDLSGGFLSGEVFDDATGRPLAGARVRLFAAEAALPGAVASGEEGPATAEATTDGRGRYVLTGEVAAGRYVLAVEGPEATRVYRRLSLRPSAGLVPFDVRLTPLGEPAGSLDPVAGGTVTRAGAADPRRQTSAETAQEALSRAVRERVGARGTSGTGERGTPGVAAKSAGPGLTFTVDPAALPGVEPLEVTLTALSGQGLPDFLPLGWTPATAAHVGLTQGGAALAEQALWTLGAAELTLPLPSWVETGDELYAARYQPGTGRWLALPLPELMGAGDGGGGLLARVALDGPGTVALVVPDGHPETRPPSLPAGPGDPLLGVELPELTPALAAELTLEPPVVAPTGRSRARVVARSADLVTPWPSGLAVQAFLEERLVLSGGGELLEAPFVADLVLYQPRLSAEERAGAAPGSAGAVEFVVSPSPRAAQVLLEVGWEIVRLYPFPEEVERGPVVGPDGGSVSSPAGVELVIPEGALSSKVPVSATLLSAAELAALPAVAGYDTVAAVRIDLSGATLARPATLSLPTPAGTPVEAPGEPRVILAELLEAPLDGRSSLARLASRTTRQGAGSGERLLASPELAGALPLFGIVREGLYLVLAAHQPLGFATGFVVGATGVSIAHSRVEATGLGTGDLSALTGRYAVPVTAGAERLLRARHPAMDEAGEGILPFIAPSEVAHLDLTVFPVPPALLSVSPAGGAAEVPLASAVTALFDKPLDPASVTSSTLTLELVLPGGGSSGIFVDATVRLASDQVRVLFEPHRPLSPGRTYRARFTGSLAAASGAIYTGGPHSWSFSTSTAIAPGGQVDPSKFHVRIPVDGVAEIYGEPGAMPGSPSGTTPWAVSPEIEGPVADPVRDTFQGQPDGSFSGHVGRPPDFPATLSSRIWVKVFDPQGELAAEFLLGPFVTPDGKGFVAQPGEAVTFTTAEGIAVEVPAGAFDTPTVVTVRHLASETVGVATPPGLGLGAFIDLDFEGEANETLRLHVPAPAGAEVGAQVFVGKPLDLPWGRRLQFLTMGAVVEEGGALFLSNDASVQPEPPPGAMTRREGEKGRTTALRSGTGQRSCRNALDEGLPKCFLQSLLMEFTLRSQAVFYFESGVAWSVMTGFAQPFPLFMGIQQEAIYNNLADAWIYLPVPHDWNGGFVLPVLSDEPLELVRRDVATGWILAQEAYDPVSPGPGLVDIGFLGGDEPSPPMLLDARPFQLVRLPAPPPGERSRLTLEMEARSDLSGAVTVGSVSGFPVALGTTVTLFDLAPSLPLDPETTPSPPIASPTARVCDSGQAWSSAPLSGSEELLVVIGPGDLDASALDALELQFDRPIKDVTQRPPHEVARLQDLGPLSSCGGSPAAGYPKSIPVLLFQSDRRSRLVVLPTSNLAAGHRFALEIEPAAIEVENPDGPPLTYWASAPTRFELATREIPGEPIAGMPQGVPALGETTIARDMVKLGNLLVVASETGDLVAVDVSRASESEGFRWHAIKNKGLQSATRSLATDGHNRIFYSGLFGHVWGVKASRLEDLREAGAPCASQPAWAAGLPCFEGVQGSVRIAYALGSTSGTTASEWLALGTLPEGTPMRLAILAQDEKGRELELADFVSAYGHGVTGLGGLAADAQGIYTFDVALASTLTRWQSGTSEPSLPPGSAVEEAIARWRESVCEGEEPYDRYQRVTIDNLSTGQSWSIDVENPWPDGGVGDGTSVVSGVRARQGDELQVRYNLRALGHVAILGSGITVVDLNRFYRLTQPGQSPGGGQCGRRLGKFEGQQLVYPSCAPPGIELDGIAMTPSVVTQSATGCDTGQCRGEGFIDIYSPLMRVGALHTRTTATAPGGARNELTGELDGFQLGGFAACIGNVGGRSVMLREVALANDVEWIYRGVHGLVSGQFFPPPEGFSPFPLRGDLLFVSLGAPGVFVFDVSARSVLFFREEAIPALVGHLRVPGHSVTRLQVDPVRGLLFAGGIDAATGGPVIDVWDIRSINGAPGLEGEPRPIATLHAPWSTNQLGIDSTGTGLVYTWGAEEGPLAVPFERPRFVFSGIYRPQGEETERGFSGLQQATSRFVPLGVPVETSAEGQEAQARTHEEHATAAFKLRVALPGSLGPELTAKVQSLRALPGEGFLGKQEVDAAVEVSGGPGWADHEVVVRLRRLGRDDGSAGVEGGALGLGYHLYESVETVLLLADPRASRAYRRQEAAGTDADEEGQCRRCEWPGYLPDPEGNDPALDSVEELLAGRHLRAFLYPSEAAGGSTRQDTEAAIAFFDGHGGNYPPPAGSAEIAGPASAVPSPLQVSLAEPAQNGAFWSPGEAGVSVALAGGELLVAATDHQVEGRALPFVLARHYRSGALGRGPLGSAGWFSPLFAHLRELPATGEVEYHDGTGRVWRFYPRTLPEAPPGYEEDFAGSYYVPEGLYLRLQKLSAGQGWRLVSRHHDVMLFDGEGRLAEVSDRHHRGGSAGERGNRMRFLYDPFGQLVTVIDDLGRRYRFSYHEDPRPTWQGGDGPRYGLLKSVSDFVGREVAYEYDGERRLIRVLLPEVSNPVEAYAGFSYTGESRPVIEYRYDPEQGADSSAGATGALLHGDFAKLRLAAILLPDFVPGVTGVPRARFEYQRETGRVAKIAFPTPENQNSSTASVDWTLQYSPAFPADRVTVRSPWGHETEHVLADGRMVETREELVVEGPSGPIAEPLATTYEHAEDGRLLSIERPDGSRVSHCYADGAGGPGCGGGGSVVQGADLLSRANVVASQTTALTQAARGSADYETIVSSADYQEDNILSSVMDGEGRPIELAVAEAGGSATSRFVAEGVSASQEYDAYGRPTRFTGGGEGAPATTLAFGADSRGRQAAGLVSRVERGEGDGLAFWHQLSYDDAFNVEEVETSQGTRTRTVHDRWDRPVRTVTGLSSDGRFAPVGAASCALGEGAVVERAFDAAGHVVRERRLQDYVDPADGESKCRFVESRFFYNAREQLVRVEETHLASAVTPGQVVATPQPVTLLEYDLSGRLHRERTRALSRPDLVTTYRYDPAGRVAATTTGEEGERRVAYDELSRVVLATDGDEGVWRGRHDAWGRVFHEELPTGAVVRRRFDRAHNPIQETTFDADPLTVPGAKVLADTRSHVTSFGAVERIVETLAAAEDGAPAALRVTEQVFDASGRVVEVWSGPPHPEDATRVDLSQGRRELALEYEISGGRVIAERYGGDETIPPLHAVTYAYGPESAAPWPDAVTLLESVPGLTELVETSSASYRRDAFGRPVEERRSDGSLLATVFDRSGEAIRAMSGAGTQASVSLDGRGLPIKVVRPLGRGFSVYAYDLDGTPLLESTRTATAELWETAYAYDATGRVASITYADGTSESFTYNPDSTVASQATRDGLLLTFAYDEANRLRGVTPALAGETTTRIDQGDAFDYDELARPTQLQRGRLGVPGFDPALAVRLEGYDLASRPGAEIVGARTPLSWRWDTWDRPVEVTLPAGAARDAAGSFQGFHRRYDTLDRLVEISGLGTAGVSSTPVGATWTWGGADRLYAIDTKGALGTAARYGYHAGAGPQVPGHDPDASPRWQLATLTWGAAGGAAATSVPASPWGSFGFGWRGHEGDPADGAKLGRKVLALSAGSPDLLGGLGWSWEYDGGVRLARAATGAGDLEGRGPPPGSGAESFSFGYGEGDELERIVREATGALAELETGPYGRILARNGLAFAYDGAGRRLEDDRFHYRWDWRGQLVEVRVKEEWPAGPSQVGPDSTPWAGHLLRYDYDAAGRLAHKWHYGTLPEGETDDELRPFIEKRVYVWEGLSLAAIAAFGNAEETIFRWRVLLVPGPIGLDDAVQAVVEIGDQPANPYSGSRRTYTLIRDELGTIVALVDEDESATAGTPVVPLRFHYTPFGEARAESGPELLRARFDNGATEVETGGGRVTQSVADPSLAAPGALAFQWSLGLDSSSLPDGLTVERRGTGGNWVPLSAEEVAVGTAPLDGVSAGGGGPPQLLVMATDGWQRGTSYRVSLAPSLTDSFGRPFGREEVLEWQVPEASAGQPAPPLLFDKRFPARYETWAAASDTAGGRFPGGFELLFQGLLHDRVTGLAMARARVYDPRNAAWLAEDPLGAIDSVNLYAFVGWGPQSYTDPMGTCAGDWKARLFGIGCAEGEEDAGVVGEFAVGAVLDTAAAFIGGTVDLAFHVRREGLIGAGKEIASGVRHAVVNAPESVLAWLEYMNEATPEQAARSFGRIGGEIGLAVVPVAGTTKAVGVGGKLTRRGHRAMDAADSSVSGARAGLVAARRAEDVPTRAPSSRAAQLQTNQLVGNRWDEYVAATKLRRLDDADLLQRQAHVTLRFDPDIPQTAVRPDYVLLNRQGRWAAIGDAKALQAGVIEFSAQSKGLVRWARATETRQLIYYVPWHTRLHRDLVRFARREGVSIRVVQVK